MPRKSNSRAAQGAGTIRKKTVTRKGTAYTYWEVRTTTGYDSGTGRQIQRSFSGKTQKDVREKMQAIAIELNNGTYKEPLKMTVGELARYLGKRLSKQCQASHTRDLCSLDPQSFKARLGYHSLRSARHTDDPSIL